MIDAHDLILDEDAVYLPLFHYSDQRNFYFSYNDITFNAPVHYDKIHKYHKDLP